MQSQTDTGLDNIEFTYYGDLLGISNLYSIDKEIAHKKLDDFYNSVWSTFKNAAIKFKKPNLSIFLFSDSIFITGRKLKTTLILLAELYYKLFVNKIFLRGAIVKGKLDFDPRIELENITKQLPRGDVLFRAVTLEKSVKGARLLLEKPIAQSVLPPNWLTDELYAKNICNPKLSIEDFRRRIVLHRGWKCYEYLWTWPTPSFLSDLLGENIDTVLFPKKMLRQLALRMPKSVSCHYRETKELFDIAAYRAGITKNALESGKNKTISWIK